MRFMIGMGVVGLVVITMNAVMLFLAIGAADGDPLAPDYSVEAR